jgi:hypothetical protein
MKEVKQVFDKTLRLTGCQAHWFAELNKRIGEVSNLTDWMVSSSSFPDFIEAIKGLCYVPPELVPEYFKALIDEELPEVLENLLNSGQKSESVNNYKVSLNSFVCYIKKIYIGRRGHRGGNAGRFPPIVWNQVDNVLEGRPLLTNRPKEFYSRLESFQIFNLVILLQLTMIMTLYFFSLRKLAERSASIWSMFNDASSVEAIARAARDNDGGPVSGARAAEAGPRCFGRRHKLNSLREIILRRE